MTDNFTELAFTESVKTQQEKYGTRTAYVRMEQGGKFRNQLTWQEKKHIEDRDGFYLSSVGENGWPYIQFRGGPKGFLKVTGDNTLAFADFRGNGQYISTGNLNVNKKNSFISYGLREEATIENLGGSRSAGPGGSSGSGKTIDHTRLRSDRRAGHRIQSPCVRLELPATHNSPVHTGGDR